MLVTDYTSKLLDLEDEIITNVESIADQLHIYPELPRTAHTCPACNANTDRVHERSSSRRRCLSAPSQAPLPLLPRKAFLERNSFL